MKIIAVIIIFVCVYFSVMLFMDQVVQKINPSFSDKKAYIIGAVISLFFALGALFFGGDTSPLLHDQYN